MPVEPKIHPFPGLRHFETDEEDLFFGREGQSEEILRRLRHHRFLAVVGASGSGKSSLIRAGLLPYLHGGFLGTTGSRWRVAIFRPGNDPIANLAAALDHPSVLGEPAENADEAAKNTILPEAVTTGLYLIPRMTREQRRAAIVEPVRVGGGSIAPRLVNRLLNDVGDNPDQLPILQHALMRTWDYWQAHDPHRRPIDLEDYRAIGGMAEALSLHADEAYGGLPDD